MATAYLGLGSNIRPETNLRIAMQALRSRFEVLAASPVYRSRAYGFDGDDFLNAVVAVRTELSPAEICSEIESIHRRVGRNRNGDAFVSRELDIDLLLYGDAIIEDPPVRVPRPDILEYGFVLGPLADVGPQVAHPQTGRTIAEHWAEFDRKRHPIEKTGFTLQ